MKWIKNFKTACLHLQRPLCWLSVSFEITSCLLNFNKNPYLSLSLYPLTVIIKLISGNIENSLIPLHPLPSHPKVSLSFLFPPFLLISRSLSLVSFYCCTKCRYYPLFLLFPLPFITYNSFLSIQFSLSLSPIYKSSSPVYLHYTLTQSLLLS